ncbi:hypothetical protein HDV04_005410 [Boothiomyces sp. JEL0838]|nr:hypothetical protein HDV04_005410 [Boothiomyces sp. JEL0838]
MLSLLTAAAASSPIVQDYYSFLVVGDYGFTHNAVQDQLATTMNGWARDTGAAHIVGVGDNIYYNGVKSIDDSQWDSNWYQPFKANQPYLRELPWHAMLGNHDYCYGNPWAEIQYKQNGWRMDDFFWSFSVQLPSSKTAAFVYLDTNFLAYGPNTQPWILQDCHGMFDAFQQQISKNKWSVESQLNEIENLLLKSQSSDWVFVFGHHPLGYGPCGAEGNLNQLASLLEKYHIQMYINGHVHSLDYGTSPSGTPYFTSGAGGDVNGGGCKPQNANQWSKDHLAGFISCKIQGNEAYVSVVDSHGATIFSTVVNPKTNIHPK